MDSGTEEMSAAVSESTVESTHPGMLIMNTLLSVSITDHMITIFLLFFQPAVTCHYNLGYSTDKITIIV